MFSFCSGTHAIESRRDTLCYLSTMRSSTALLPYEALPPSAISHTVVVVNDVDVLLML